MTREELQAKLEEILGSRNVYFQPPENLKMSYPCIRYEADTYWINKADNSNYRVVPRYILTHITRDPEDATSKKILNEIPTSSNTSSYLAEGLYHHIFNIF